MGVAVNVGGACGGLLNFCGAMVDVVTGRIELQVGDVLRGLIWLRIEDRRVCARNGARMTTKMRKQRIATAKKRGRREEARLRLRRVVLSSQATALIRASSNVLFERRIT